MSGTGTEIAKAETQALVIMGYRAKALMRDAAGQILSYSAAVPLIQGKHIHTIEKKETPAADAFYLANRVAGLAILEPPTVVVDGVERPNPYIERDPASKTVTNVFIKRAVVGRGPTGKVSMVQVTTNFDLNTYFLQSLQKKMKNHTYAVRDAEAQHKKTPEPIALYGQRGEKPATLASPFFMAIGGDFGIWADSAAPEIQDALNDWTQKKKFADRLAATICERTAMRKHPAFGGGIVKRTDKGVYLEVTACVGRVEEADIAAWLKSIESGKRVDDVDYVEGETVKADDAEVAAAASDAEEADFTDINTVKPANGDGVTEKALLISQISHSPLGPVDRGKIMSRHGCKAETLNIAALATLRAIVADINTELDGEKPA